MELYILINHFYLKIRVVAVVKLMQLYPATSATGEKSFSTARTKTRVCLTINRECFESVYVLNVHKLRLDNLNL